MPRSAGDAANACRPFEAMRIAALYDIHGNLPALEAVLRAAQALDVESYVIGGDVLPGPMPVECLSLLRSLGSDAAFISGNGEADVLALRDGREVERVPRQYLDVMRWSASQLGDDDAAWLASWPSTTRRESSRGVILFCHASPRNDSDIVTRATNAEAVQEVFAGQGAPIVVCGHTHMQFDRKLGDVRVINAGSVGMPFGPRGAYWLLIDDDVRPQHTPYDFEDTATRIRRSGYPRAGEFASQAVLSPPDEATMIAAFGKTELGR
jgi:predicted phosphodiesterase